MEPDRGSWTDPDQRITFRFEGRTIEARAGDTIASALAANGRYVLSRSFKYHRPRGPLSLAGNEANCLVQVGGEANVPADLQDVAPDMRVSAQNTLGSLKWDFGAVIQWFSRWLPVGFYYRAFYWPRGAWNTWSRLFRRAAGLGVLDQQAGPILRQQQHLFCDLLVIGGGVAGLQAARQAAENGLEVILVDRNQRLGGALSYRRPPPGTSGDTLLEEFLEPVRAHPGILSLTGATANGWFEDHWIPVVQEDRMLKVRAGQVLVCAGVIEQPAVFRNNDLPGILLGGAAQRLIRRYGVRPGRTAVVLSGNDRGYELALDLLDAGVAVSAMVEMRAAVPELAAARELAQAGVRIETGATVYQARAHRFSGRLSGVELRSIDAPGRTGAHLADVDCDVLVVSVGYMPAFQIPCQAGAGLTYLDEQAVFRIDGLPDGMSLAGAINGCTELDQARADASQAAARCLGQATTEDDGRRWLDRSGASVNFAFPVFPHPRGREFVDFDEDLQISDIVRAVREGYSDVQLAKRFSTCGMGPSQGRHSALAMARIVANETGKTVTETGVTTARPPVGPETIGHCAGRVPAPCRHTPMQTWHQAAGAQWMVAGSWRRPAHYGESAYSREHIEQEVRSVRERAGIIDVSTLGGIDVLGPDAGEFMDRMYTGRLARLAVGKSRYAVMTNEAGALIDDGVACRFAPEHFYVTTTTTGAESVYRNMLWWQAQWRLRVDIVNVSTAWAAFNVAGPAARDILHSAGFGAEITTDSMPFLAARSLEWSGFEMRLMRVGFVGELGFEIHLPFHAARSVWEHVLDAGTAAGLRPFGVEAQRILRLEKGHLIVGQDSDAMSNPMELGMDWAIAWDKPFFVGQRSLQALSEQPRRRCLAGFMLTEEVTAPPAENHLVVHDGQVIGRVTSVCRSPTLGRVIGLAMIPPARAESGSAISIRGEGGRMLPAEVVDLPFYDPTSERQKC
jgi:sarcosine oxidase subunit alpha